MGQENAWGTVAMLLTIEKIAYDRPGCLLPNVLMAGRFHRTRRADASLARTLAIALSSLAFHTRATSHFERRSTDVDRSAHTGIQAV